MPGHFDLLRFGAAGAMDVTACDWLLGDFLAVEKHAVAQDEDQASLKERDERARERWKAESGFKNAFVTTVVMLPYRLQDLYGAWGTWRAVPVILWYLALLAYFARRRWMCGRQGTTRTILEGIFMGSQGDEADTKWLIVLQVMWAAAGQFWYLSMKDLGCAYRSESRIFDVLANRRLSIWMPMKGRHPSRPPLF